MAGAARAMSGGGRNTGGDTGRRGVSTATTAAAAADVERRRCTAAMGVAAKAAVAPPELDASWRDLKLAERYYLRALDIESRGERRQGMYEELARGFGVTDIKLLLKSDKANGARMHTASGFGAAGLAPLAGTGDAGAGAALPARRGRSASGAPHPFAAAP